MEIDVSGLTVVHNEPYSQFEIALGSDMALLTYRRQPGRIIFNHTEVPPAFRMRGVAAKLTRAALDYARAQDVDVVPSCPYVAAYIRKHPEDRDLLTPEDLKRYVTG
jgi:hypothetical protein